MTQVAILNMPRLDLTRPAIAPGILKSLATGIGMTSKIFDFALKIYEESKREDWDQYELLWQIDLDYHLPKALQQKLNAMFDRYVQEVLREDPEFIAISVFSHNSITACDMMIRKLRPKTNAKIIIGGVGMMNRQGDTPFHLKLAREGLIDYFCVGEAETTFVNVLQNNLPCAGVNNEQWKQLDNLDNTPIPDYNDYQFNKYHHLSHGKSLWINGSRGCVRRCDFCDVGVIWKKFRFRSGESLCNELKHQMQRYDIRGFQFGDALINGSQKAFNDLNYNLIKFIEQSNRPKPYIGGHYIVRPKNQVLKEHYQMQEKAGLDLISIGIETGSDALRYRMNKKFTNEDLIQHLEYSKQHKLKNMIMMFAGHPTETEEDHKETIKLLRGMKHYVASGNLVSMELNQASVIRGTPLGDWAMKNNVIFPNNHWGGDHKFWFNPDNPGNTLKVRVARVIDILETAIDVGIGVRGLKSRLVYSKKLLEIAKEKNFQY